jgi:hypothetical protein
MLALIQNEYAAYLVIIILVLGIAIHKFYGLKKFFRLFTGSSERVETARAAKAAKAEPAKAKTAKASAETAD